MIHAKMKECDTQISGYVTDQEKYLQKLSDMKLEKKKLENEVSFLTRLLVMNWFMHSVSNILLNVLYLP